MLRVGAFRRAHPSLIDTGSVAGKYKTDAMVIRNDRERVP
jgi:hypothetical protein